ncbi:putative major facilitator superfamily transporter [Aureobasidium pullulans]|nr:putative major facilitator superfamily transporter [Aureobasidium pullulans]
MERSTYSSGNEAGITTTTEIAMPRDTILPEATPSSVPFEHLQIAEKHTIDQPLQEEITDDDDPYNGRSKSKVAVIMLALCTAVFLGTLDSTIVTTALPTITEHFNSASGYTWIGSAFLLANASTIPSWGKASDIFGRKPMLLLANVVFMIGSLVAALSNSVGMLVAARAVQGLGSGGLVIVNITIGDLFSLRTRGAFYGILGGIWASASSIGPIIGGLLTQGASWRWCFWINLPLDGLAFIVLFFCLDIESPSTPLLEGLKAIDWIGSFLVIGATLMFLFGIQYGGETYPWNSAIVICLITFGLLTFALFLLYECKVPKYPIMDLSFLNSRTNIATLSTAFIHGLVFISGTYYLPLYFQAVRGATPIFSGIYLLPTALAASASSFAAGIFVRNHGAYLPSIYTGFLIMTVGFGLFVDLDVHSTWAKLVTYQIIAGVGFGALFQAPFIALQAHIHPRDIGVATTTLGFTRQMATSISVVIGQAVYQNAMTAKTEELTTSLGPEPAGEFSGGGVVANAGAIDALPGYQREVVRNVLAESLQPMWVMYTVFSSVGLLAALFIQKKVLSVRHEETVTGLAVERQNAVERAAERQVKRAGKINGRAGV